MPKPVESIKSRELWIITDNPSRNKPGAGYRLRVVQYYKPATGSEAAKSISVKLESGEYFRGDDGGQRFKAKGLSPRDVKELLRVDITHKKRVILVVEGLQDTPPPLPAEEAAPAETSAADDPGF